MIFIHHITLVAVDDLFESKGVGFFRNKGSLWSLFHNWRNTFEDI